MDAKEMKFIATMAVIVILLLTTIGFLRPAEWDVYKATLTSDGCAWAQEEGINIQPKPEGRCTALLRLKCMVFSEDVSIRMNDDRIAILTGRAFTTVTKASDTESLQISKTPEQAAVNTRLGTAWISALFVILLIWMLPVNGKPKRNRK